VNLLNFNNWIRLTENTEASTDYSTNNLDVTQYRNGDPIPFIESSETWSELTTGAYCYYYGEPEKGILYNWYAVNDPRGLAPVGWKIPTIDELEKIDLTGGPSGKRVYVGNYLNINSDRYFWSSTELDKKYAWNYTLTIFYNNVSREDSDKRNGLSVRCIPDFDDAMLNLVSDF
jgi:hypothetical protein